MSSVRQVVLEEAAQECFVQADSLVEHESGRLRRGEVEVLRDMGEHLQRLASSPPKADRRSLLDVVRDWLSKHHGPLDARYLRSFFDGDCQHPYHVKQAEDLRSAKQAGDDLEEVEGKHVCDLCGG